MKIKIQITVKIEIQIKKLHRKNIKKIISYVQIKFTSQNVLRTLIDIKIFIDHRNNDTNDNNSNHHNNYNNYNDDYYYYN